MMEERASDCIDYAELYGRSSLDEMAAHRVDGELLVPRSRKGLMEKLASGVVKNWKSRYFQLDKGTLVYYEPSSWYVKGQYDLVGLIFAHNFPGDTPEMIRLQLDGRPDIVLKAKDIESKNKWRHSLAEHIRYATTIKEREIMTAQTTPNAHLSIPTPSSRPVLSQKMTTTAPPDCKGWLWKKGQFIPTIKKRFFMLEAGILSYYPTDVTSLLEGSPDTEIISRNNGGEPINSEINHGKSFSLPKPLGVMSIKQYHVFQDSLAGRLELILTPSSHCTSTRKLSLYCEDFVQRDIWAQALTSHAAYDPDHNENNLLPKTLSFDEE